MWVISVLKRFSCKLVSTSSSVNRRMSLVNRFICHFSNIFRLRVAAPFCGLTANVLYDMEEDRDIIRLYVYIGLTLKWSFLQFVYPLLTTLRRVVFWQRWKNKLGIGNFTQSKYHQKRSGRFVFFFTKFVFLPLCEMVVLLFHSLKRPSFYEPRLWP